MIKNGMLVVDDFCRDPRAGRDYRGVRVGNRSMERLTDAVAISAADRRNGV
ncbi:MAG: hypothetical protein AAFY99_03730 [Pseudomonadota bacterium]